MGRAVVKSHANCWHLAQTALFETHRAITDYVLMFCYQLTRTHQRGTSPLFVLERPCSQAC